MQLEQVLIKLGVDTSQVDEGLRRAQVKVADGTKYMHKSFIHASDGARQFKSTLHEIAGSIGPLGSLLYAVISPIGAAFSVAAASAAYFEKKLEEVNRELDSIGERNARPIGNMRESMREAGDAARDFQRSWDEWMKNHDEARNPGQEWLSEEIKLLQGRYELVEKMIEQEVHLGRVTAIRGEQMKYAARVEQAKRASEAAELALGAASINKDQHFQAAYFSGLGFNAQNSALKFDLPKRIAELEARSEELKKERAGLNPPDETRSSKPRHPAIDAILTGMFGGTYAASRYGDDFSGGIQTPARKKLEENTRLLDQNAAALKAAREELDKMKDSTADAQTAFDQQKHGYDVAFDEWKGLKDKVRETKDTLTALQANPHAGGNSTPYANDRDMPSLEQVARTGQYVRSQRTAFNWVWQPGPFSGIAQQYMNVRGAAANARAWGNVEGYNALESRREQLEGILKNAGLLPQEVSMQKMSDGIEWITKFFSQVSDGQSKALRVVGTE